MPVRSVWIPAVHPGKVQDQLFQLPEKKYVILSPREIEVLQWLKVGKSSWDISEILHISERTVNFHIRNIMQKLDAVNRTQAVAVAIEKGLIDIN